MPVEPVNISFTLEFKRNLRTLARKYRSIRSDIRGTDPDLLAHCMLASYPLSKGDLRVAILPATSFSAKGSLTGY